MTRMLFNDYDREPEEENLEGSENARFLEEDFMYQAASANAHEGFSQLSERDQAILGFERQWWKYSGAKEAAIRELFDMSSTRYYQLINTLIDTPEAMEFDPMLVKRLRRMRSSRQAARTANRANIR
jgi:hypothetical protein